MDENTNNAKPQQSRLDNIKFICLQYITKMKVIFYCVVYLYSMQTWKLECIMIYRYITNIFVLKVSAGIQSVYYH